MSQKFACTLVDQICIQIYDQISILRNCLKGKLRRAVSTGLSLKGVKIAWNIAKVGVHACLFNMHRNIWSGLNSKDLVKAETASCSFLGFGLKMAKIALNIVKIGMHSYFPNADLNLWLNFNFEKLVKREFRCAVFLMLGLKGVKIFWNVSKVCMHACWSNWHPNLWSNSNSKNLLERETPSFGFNRVGLKGGQNNLKRRESWRACLSIQDATKHMIRFKF